MAFDVGNVSHLEISSPDYAGKQLAVINVERVDTGAGALNAPIMPLPVQLLAQFGTPAKIYARATGGYNPATGEVTVNADPTVEAMVYPEAYTLKECEEIPGVVQGDVKVYVPGQSMGFTTVALLLMQCREQGV
jgi:hypothetical protein